MVNTQAYLDLKSHLATTNTTLIAVSKIKPASDIQTLYNLGQRAFGENYVQELCEKQPLLPNDIEWHFIGHLQSNKVKYIAPFVKMIHGVDSFKLLAEINKQAAKHNRVIDCLLQLHIADESTKFGFDEKELYVFGEQYEIEKANLKNIRVRGMMGMSSFSDDEIKVKAEFDKLKTMFDIQKTSTFLFDPNFDTVSMGMSGDYDLAIASGSNMVRVGSLLFGRRN